MTPVSTSRMSVPTTDMRIDVRQPIRFEKNNIALGPSACRRQSPDAERGEHSERDGKTAPTDLDFRAPTVTDRSEEPGPPGRAEASVRTPMPPVAVQAVEEVLAGDMAQESDVLIIGRGGPPKALLRRTAEQLVHGIEVPRRLGPVHPLEP